MDDLIARLRALNDKVAVPDAGRCLVEDLKSRIQPETQTISYASIKYAAALAFLIVLTNVSVMIWSGNKDAVAEKRTPANTYLQTYNLNIY